MAEDLSRRPAEIFGYPIENQSDAAQDARQKYWCPFREGPCIKKSRLIDFPFGVCSVEYDGGTRTICPHRFEERGSIAGVARVLEDIAVHRFGNDAEQPLCAKQRCVRGKVERKAAAQAMRDVIGNRLIGRDLNWMEEHTKERH